VSFRFSWAIFIIALLVSCQINDPLPIGPITDSAVVVTTVVSATPSPKFAAEPGLLETQVAIPPIPAVQLCLDENNCISGGHFFLGNPISGHGNQFVDQTYRYGNTQNKTRETHHGVEFPNKEGIPVLAVYAGEVIFAGSDEEHKIAWVPNFYGNVVVIRHNIEGVRLPIYSLYGHLKEVTVTKGQQLHLGKMIGTVGATGSAVGSHLHFEVRIGYNNYSANQNPVLWMRPGDGMGVVAGIVKSEDGDPKEALLNIQRVNNGILEKNPYTSVEPYEKTLLPAMPDIILHENFAVGDMPAGDYRISMVYDGNVYEQYFRVVDGKLTYIVFDVH
jgi:murein DD-endopeptidase MepM/ murein hydrolase activator NlpD